MARLILLNGPPGIGKSTLARRWVADQVMAVVVEIDALRTSIDGWQDDDRTKLEARQLAVEVTDAHLRGGYDVMVPQYLGLTTFIDELEQTARSAGAGFVELVLLADEDDVVARFEQRRAALAAADHPEHDVDDVPAAIADANARLERVGRARPNTIVLPAGGDVEEVLSRLAELLEQ